MQNRPIEPYFPGLPSLFSSLFFIAKCHQRQFAQSDTSSMLGILLFISARTCTTRANTIIVPYYIKSQNFAKRIQRIQTLLVDVHGLNDLVSDFHPQTHILITFSTFQLLGVSNIKSGDWRLFEIQTHANRNPHKPKCWHAILAQRWPENTAWMEIKQKMIVYLEGLFVDLRSASASAQRHEMPAMKTSEATVYTAVIQHTNLMWFCKLKAHKLWY